MSLIRSLPENAVLSDLRSKYADLFDLLRPYADRLMRGPSPLASGDRELIAAYVSGINSCRYCFGSHSLVARGFGINESVFEALMRDLDHAPVTPILRYVRKLTETPSKMTTPHSDAVYAEGWNDETLVHAVAVCAYFNNMNRLVEGSGIVGSPDEYANAAARLLAHGYGPAGPSGFQDPQTSNK